MVASCDYKNVMYELHFVLGSCEDFPDEELLVFLHGIEGSRSLFEGRKIAFKEYNEEDNSLENLLVSLSKKYGGEIVSDGINVPFIRYINHDIQLAEDLLDQEKFSRIEQKN